MDRFVVEGLHPVGEALEAGWDVETILYAPDVLVSDFAKSLLADHAERLQPVTNDVMESMAGKDNPQGILAIVAKRHPILSEWVPAQQMVAMVSPQDPGNLGTVLRTMDAVGADALFLVDGGVDPYHPACVRASMGALFWKPVFELSFAELLTWSKPRMIQTIATSAHAQKDYRQFHPSQPWLLVLGPEQKGLSAEQLRLCNAAVALPMRGRASSLNLAVAAGLFLYEFCV
jgi:TrmH family RNA methyltransferase